MRSLSLYTRLLSFHISLVYFTLAVDVLVLHKIYEGSVVRIERLAKCRSWCRFVCNCCIASSAAPAVVNVLLWTPPPPTLFFSRVRCVEFLCKGVYFILKTQYKTMIHLVRLLQHLLIMPLFFCSEVLHAAV